MGLLKCLSGSHRYQCKLFTRFVIHYLHQHFKDKERSKEREEEGKGEEEEKGKGEEEEEGTGEEEEGMGEEEEEVAVVQQDGRNIVFDTDTLDMEDPEEYADSGKSVRPEIQEAVQRFQKLSSARQRARKEEGESSKGEEGGAAEQLKIGGCGS